MINDLPKVSVIIPAYNRVSYICQAVDSVLSQTFKNIELIVIDDGSTDGTRDILESYGDRICLLEHPGKVNKGQSSAINLGIKKATGNYIAILDSDDYWSKVKIELQVAYLEKNIDVGLVYCNGIAVDEFGEYLYDIYTPSHEEHNKPENVLLDCYLSVPSNSLFRKEVIDLAGYLDESLRTAQDHDIAIRIAEVTRLGYLAKQLFYYRRHPDSISKYHAGMRWINGFKILGKAKIRYPYPRRIILKRKAVLHFRLFQDYIKCGRYILAFKHLLLSGTCDPLRAIRVLLRREKINKLN